MMGQQSFLIVGNGIAGVTAAEILRTEDSAAEITVVADDPFPVYYRPALKDYLGGKLREDKLWARLISFYQDHRIRFLNDRVVGLEIEPHRVLLRGGQALDYTRLLLAHSARASTLTCPGLDLVGVTTLRTVADYQRVLSRLNNVRCVVITENGPESPALLMRGGMGVPCLGLARWGIGWIIPSQEGINGSPYQFRYRHAFPFRSHMKTFQLLFR